MHVLTVMLVNDGSGKAAALKEALAQAGVRVVAEISPDMHLNDVLLAARPDVVLIDSDAPSRDMLEQLCVMGGKGGCPVVMFTDDASRDTIRSALNAGVAAYVVGEVEHSRILPLLEVAIERHRLETSRRAELVDARQQLADRKLIEKAKGLLMQMKSLDEASAYRQLRERAMKQQKKLAEVAREIISLADWLKS